MNTSPFILDIMGSLPIPDDKESVVAISSDSTHEVYAKNNSNSTCIIEVFYDGRSQGSWRVEPVGIIILGITIPRHNPSMKVRAVFAPIDSSVSYNSEVLVRVI